MNVRSLKTIRQVAISTKLRGNSACDIKSLQSPVKIYLHSLVYFLTLVATLNVFNVIFYLFFYLTEMVGRSRLLAPPI